MVCDPADDPAQVREAWALAEAIVRCCADEDAKAPERGASALCDLLQSGRLVGFGVLPADAAAVAIEPGRWRAAALDVDRNCVHATSPAETYANVTIYPVLHAPDAAHRVVDMALKDVIWKFVLGDPEVQRLSKLAIAAQPELRRIYEHGILEHRGPWPLTTELGLAGSLPPKGMRDWVDSSESPAVEQAGNALVSRYEALLHMLRNRVLNAVGDPVRAGDERVLLPSIWSHRDYKFDLYQGDITASEQVGDRYYDLPRWRAVWLTAGPALQPRNFVMAPAPSPIISRADAERECRAWLAFLMRASPDQRTATIGKLKEEAFRKWPDRLSEQGFKRAWKAAIETTGARGWSRGGRPPKTRNQKPE